MIDTGLNQNNQMRRQILLLWFGNDNPKIKDEAVMTIRDKAEYLNITKGTLNKLELLHFIGKLLYFDSSIKTNSMSFWITQI